MKEFNLYQCEICGTQYAIRSYAEECEASHHTPVSVTGSKYRSKKANPSGYPGYVAVTFDDGSIKQYRLS